MKILITGGAGFIGSHIAAHFQHEAEVVILDNLRSGHRENLDGLDVTFIEADVCDRAAVREAMQGVDYVFHLAAMISVPESMKDPFGCAAININGLLNVLEEATAANVKKLCFASSAAIYGNDPAVPKTEDMMPDPLSPYAITKLDGEFYCAMYAREGRLPTACLRFFNVFGPRQDPKSAYAAAVPIFIERARKHEAITVYGDGEQTRDFVYVKDIAAALAFAATTAHVTGNYNVGYGERTSINALAKMIIAGANSRSELRHQPERPGDIKHSLASPDKLQAAGFKPSYNLQQGLAETLAET